MKAFIYTWNFGVDRLQHEKHVVLADNREQADQIMVEQQAGCLALYDVKEKPLALYDVEEKPAKRGLIFSSRTPA